MTTQFTVTAYTDHADTVAGIDVSAYCQSREDAEAFVATLPRSWRVMASTLSTTFEPTTPYRLQKTLNALALEYGLATHAGDGFRVGAIHLRVNFTPDGVNGGKNEAGLRRVRRFLAHVGEWDYEMPYRNSPTREVVERFLGQ